jgi:hypothetical protein
VRKFISATVSAALCLMSAAPAMAQDYRFAGFDPPQGATATVNLRVPIGGENVGRPTYGLTVGYGYAMGGANLNGQTVSRSVNFADFRFSGTEMRNARIATFDLANLDQDRRLNLTGSGKKTWLLLGAIVVAGVVICIAAECFDGDDDEDEGTSTPGT